MTPPLRRLVRIQSSPEVVGAALMRAAERYGVLLAVPEGSAFAVVTLSCDHVSLAVIDPTDEEQLPRANSVAPCMACHNARVAFAKAGGPLRTEAKEMVH